MKSYKLNLKKYAGWLREDKLFEAIYTKQNIKYVLAMMLELYTVNNNVAMGKILWQETRSILVKKNKFLKDNRDKNYFYEILCIKFSSDTS